MGLSAVVSRFAPIFAAILLAGIAPQNTFAAKSLCDCYAAGVLRA